MSVLKNKAPALAVMPLSTRTFSCGFDRETGFLRRVQVGGVEVLRAIYGAVRDQNWGTVPVAISDVKLSADEDGFDLRFDAVCRAGDAHFKWSGLVRGRGDELEFEFSGRALTSFLRNRIGLCVLHPLAECVGQPCRILTVGGNWEASAFPKSIAPRQPFRNVRAMTWEPANGLRAEVGFEGDVFETEDQRNWTDASFKTYSTPLALPFPVEIAAGTEVRQRVVLKITKGPAFRAVAFPTVPEIRFADRAAATKPPLGLCLASHGGALDTRQAELLKSLNLSHLRVDLHLGDPRWKDAWQRAQADASTIGAALHCALYFGDAAELTAFAEAARSSGAPIALCLIFRQADETGFVRQHAWAENILGPLGIEIAVGTDDNFAELNRARPPVGSLVTFPLNPQVHAFDDLSLIENIEAQPDTVTSAMAFRARGVVISPITLRPRSNPKTGAEPSNVDPRQRTLFGAAWTLGCLSRLAVLPSVHSLTFYETVGACGLIDSSSGEVFPLFHIFADMTDGDVILPMECSEPQKFAALGLETGDGGRRVLVANLQPAPQTVRIECGAARATVRTLDDTSFARAMTEPERFRAHDGESLAPRDGAIELVLSAYAIARLDY